MSLWTTRIRSNLHYCLPDASFAKEKLFVSKVTIGNWSKILFCDVFTKNRKKTKNKVVKRYLKCDFEMKISLAIICEA